MAASCCGGVKKQKLNNPVVAINSSSMNFNNSSSSNHCNGMLTNGLPGGAANRVNGNLLVASPVTDTQPTSIQIVKNGRNRVVSLDMVVYCFDVLYSYLHSTESPKQPKFCNDHFPLFVTWKLGKDKKLRGCIGTFNSTSLHQGLREYAITSACKDSRFDPINTDEFARLHCSVSLLMDFEVAEHYLDWEIGVHGIRIEFNSEKGSKKAATYLPEVAVEQGWNQIQTIDSLLRKGGFKGNITVDVRTSLCLIRFQSEKMSVSYQEYMAHKMQPSSACNHVVDESGLPSKLMISNGGGDFDMNDRGGIDSGTSFSSRHYGNHHSHGHGSGHTTSPSNGYATNGTSSSTSGSGHHHFHQNRMSTSTSGGGRHSLGRHRSTSSSGGRHSPTSQKDSHHPSANAARYLPLPNHPYMPPPY